MFCYIYDSRKYSLAFPNEYPSYELNLILCYRDILAGMELQIVFRRWKIIRFKIHGTGTKMLLRITNACAVDIKYI